VPVFTRMRECKTALCGLGGQLRPLPRSCRSPLLLTSSTLANTHRRRRERQCQQIPNAPALRDQPSGHGRCALAVPLRETFAAALKRLP
jgi:hypothetical protein